MLKKKQRKDRVSSCIKNHDLSLTLCFCCLDACRIFELYFSAACPVEFPYAFDKEYYRDSCSDSIPWNPKNHPPTEAPEFDENGNELPIMDRRPVMGLEQKAVVIKCPHFPTPCTDMAGKTSMLTYEKVRTLNHLN